MSEPRVKVGDIVQLVTNYTGFTGVLRPKLEIGELAVVVDTDSLSPAASENRLVTIQPVLLQQRILYERRLKVVGHVDE